MYHYCLLFLILACALLEGIQPPLKTQTVVFPTVLPVIIHGLLFSLLNLGFNTIFEQLLLTVKRLYCWFFFAVLFCFVFFLLD